MKRILTVMIAIICACLLLTACSKEQPDPAKVINDAIEKTAALDALDATVEMEVEVKMSGISLTIPMTMECKASGIHSADPRSSIVMETSILGVTEEVNMYLEGEWMYFTAMGSSFKMKADEYEASNGSVSSGSDYLVSLPDDVLRDAELITNSDGSQTATIIVPEDIFATLFEDVISSASSASASEVDDVSVTDAQISVTIKDGYVVIFNMEVDMDMKASGQTATSTVIATAKYNNPGSDVTVTPPEGYQSFETVWLPDISSK